MTGSLRSGCPAAPSSPSPTAPAAPAEAICDAARAYEDWRMPSDWAGWLAHVDREMSRSRVGHASAVVI